MDTYLADLIGNMMADLVQFVVNVSWGYVLILGVLFVGCFIAIYLRFFKNMITETQK